MRELKILKGGYLGARIWDGKKGKYVNKKVSAKNLSSYKLHDLPCSLDDGLKLKDIFLLLNRELSLWDFVLGNWCKDFVEEGLSKITKDKKDTYDDDLIIDYLSLRWLSEVDTYDKVRSINGLKHLDFGGQGRYAKDGDYYKKDDPTAIGVSLTETYLLRDLPLKLDTNLKVIEDKTDYTKKYKKLKIKYDTILDKVELKPSLFQILYSIIWELSWHGPPKKRDARAASLRKSVEDIKSGKAKTIPAEDLFKDLKARIKKNKK